MISDIKNAIKTNLDELVTDETLGEANITDIKIDPLSTEIGAYPAAFVMPPSVESELSDNRNNVRTYTFEILVLFQAEDLQSTTELETDIEAILDKFDNDPTLDGKALGGVLPISSAPEPFKHGGKDLIAVSVQIQAKEIVQLSFS